MEWSAQNATISRLEGVIRSLLRDGVHSVEEKQSQQQVLSQRIDELENELSGIRMKIVFIDDLKVTSREETIQMQARVRMEEMPNGQWMQILKSSSNSFMWWQLENCWKSCSPYTALIALYDLIVPRDG